MLGYLSADIICSKKRTVFRERSCELLGTDNVQGQISEHIFAPNGGYCLYYPSNLLRNARSFENWGIANEARRAKLALTNLISNKHEWNNCFIKNAPKI